MIHLLGSHEFKIEVENTELVLHGSTIESAGCVLRGVVKLRLTEPTKIKSVVLTFLGKMKVEWTDCKYLHLPSLQLTKYSLCMAAPQTGVFT